MKKNLLSKIRHQLANYGRYRLYRYWSGKFRQLGEGTKVEGWIFIKGCPRNISIGRNAVLGHNVTFKCDKKTSISIGDGTSISPSVMLMTYGGSIQIGQNCSVNPFSILYGHGGLKIGNNVHIAAHTVIIPANHKFDDPNRLIKEQGTEKKGIVIEDDVWIGAGARILDGVKIGTGSVIAAGAVVNKSVAPYSVVGGVPARVIGGRSKTYRDSLLYEADPEFNQLYQDGLMLTTTPTSEKRQRRFYNLISFLGQTNDLEGAIAECGCWKGLSSYVMNHYILKKRPGYQGEAYFVLDSFEGLSAPREEDVIELELTHKAIPRKGKAFKEAGAYDAQQEQVQENLKEFPAITYVKGWIPESLSQLPEQSYRFVHIDVDLYEPTLGALEYFYPRLVKRGVIVCDDYGSLFWPGAKKALDEFCEKHGVTVLSLASGQGVIIKY